MRPAVAMVTVGLIGMLAPAGAAARAGAQLPANPADQPPFDGGRTYQLSVPRSQSESPPGFALDAQRVTAIATGSVGSELTSRAQRVRVRTRLGDNGRNQWQVDFFASGGNDIAEVVID